LEEREYEVIRILGTLNTLGINRTNIANQKEPIDTVTNQKEPIETITAHERRAENFKKWYENDENKEKHREKVRQHSKTPSTYRARYIRELNNGLMNFDRMTQKTKDKWEIKYDEDKKIYY